MLELSLDLFVHMGYEGTTVRDIAEKAQISVGLLFHYFPTKQAILEELVKLTASGIAAMEELLSSTNSPIKIFEEITKEILNSFNNPTTKKLYLLVNQLKTLESFPAVAKQIQTFDGSIQASIPIIIKGQKMGEIREGEPLALALAYWGAIQGIAEILVWYPDYPIPDYQCIADILRKNDQSPR